MLYSLVQVRFSEAFVRTFSPLCRVSDRRCGVPPVEVPYGHVARQPSAVVRLEIFFEKRHPNRMKQEEDCYAMEWLGV
jgi:hypothetical protein